MTQPGRAPHAVQVSVKGVIVRAGRVLLLKNERDEWELPGGRIEPEVAGLNLPGGYRRSVAAWFARLAAGEREAGG
jgi:hypothetical protein